MPRCCRFKFVAINHSLFPWLYFFLSRVVLDCPVLAPEAWPPVKVVAAADRLPERARVLLDLVLERLHELRLVYVLCLLAEVDCITCEKGAWHPELELHTTFVEEVVEYGTLHI